MHLSYLILGESSDWRVVLWETICPAQLHHYVSHEEKYGQAYFEV